MYRVIIKEVTEYDVENYRIEAEDGKKYSTEYSVPEGINFKRVQYKTGEKEVNEKTVYDQTTDELDVVEVIKAVNTIK